MRARLACQPGAACTAAQAGLDEFLATLATTAAAAGSEPTLASSLLDFTPSPSKAFIAVPTQSNYCAAAYTTVPYTHEDSASLFLLSQAGG
jgi:Zn-dependent M16 (insulinase) family peptidase